MKNLTRRFFIKGSAVAAAGTLLFPRRSLAQSGSPNNKLNIAVIGVGGRGGSGIRGCRDENIVALCDVNEEPLQREKEKFPEAKCFTDYRVMMDKMAREIDAVTIATPDHTHFPAAMVCMQNQKHVYVEKPLAHNVWEVRTLKKAAHYYKVVSQMGNQGHTTDGIRKVKEWYDAGVLGEVKEVFAWFNGPNFGGHYFSKPDRYPPKPDPVPDTMHWDLWIGPAKKRPFSKYYTPRTWRGWYDFGNGELGDWACHTLDAPFWSLDLGMPELVVAEDCAPAPIGFCTARSIIRFDFPARGKKPPVTLRWYDGGLKPENREEWGLDSLPGSGMIMVGEKLSLMTGGRPNDPKLLPNEVWEDFKKNPPEKTIPRVEGGPWAEWLAAIKGDAPMPGSSFDYASDLTEMALLGVLAQRFNTRVEYEAETMKVTNQVRLNDYIKEPVREGFEFGEEVWKA